MAIPEFNPTVSFYPNTWANEMGRPSPLRLILAGVQLGRWKDFVRRVRECEPNSQRYEEAKKRLPAFTACATFHPGERCLDGVDAPTYVVAMDFDEKHNLGKIAAARQQVEKDHYTWACAASAGGRGFFTLVRVSIDATKHQWFDDLAEYYRLVYGLNADRGCRDYTRLRYVSHDPDLYLNDHASIYVPAPLLPPAPRVMSPSSLAAARQYADGIDCAFDIEACVREVERTRTDITAGDGRWAALGYSLSGTLGESGRDYFHRLSMFHPHYKAGQCDKKFDACLKRRAKVTIAKFIYLLREHNIEPVRRDKTLAL